MHATVRDAAETEKYEHITRLDGAEERLKLFSADLMRDGSFDEACEGGRGGEERREAEGEIGATYVLHVASPYALDVKDPQRDLINPAVNGTLT